MERKRVFIVAEAGSNWKVGPEFDINNAKELIESAAWAGADAVKFQFFRSATTYAEGAGYCHHLWEKGIQKPIRELFSEIELPELWLPELAAHSASHKIAFMASTFSEEDFAKVDTYVTCHKIASPELHHPKLIELCARSGKPLLLSTGISTEEEIAWALELFDRTGGSEVTLLQSTVAYPTTPGAVNLRTLEFLRGRFGRAVGLSDHSRDPVTAPIAAVALGATVIEKHFTLDRCAIGPDHSWVINVDELKELCRCVRLAEEMLGNMGKRIVLEEEPLRLFSRRSLHTLKAIKQGERLCYGVNIAILRAGDQPQGAHPQYLERIEGRRLLRDLPQGAGLHLTDVEVSPS